MLDLDLPQNSPALITYTIRLPLALVNDLRRFSNLRKVPPSVMARLFIEAGLGRSFSSSELQELGV